MHGVHACVCVYIQRDIHRHIGARMCMYVCTWICFVRLLLLLLFSCLSVCPLCSAYLDSFFYDVLILQRLQRTSITFKHSYVHPHIYIYIFIHICVHVKIHIAKKNKGEIKCVTKRTTN